jgi:hypothetical protein
LAEWTQSAATPDRAPLDEPVKPPRRTATPRVSSGDAVRGREASAASAAPPFGAATPVARAEEPEFIECAEPHASRPVLLGKIRGPRGARALVELEGRARKWLEEGDWLHGWQLLHVGRCQVLMQRRGQPLWFRTAADEPAHE